MNKIISHTYKSKNFDNRGKNAKIKYLILHYTETKTLKEAIALLTAKQRKVSAHYVISKNGKIYNLVDDDKRAWHAGVSEWKRDKNLNNSSIGIEIVYEGEKTKKNFSFLQIKSLVFLLKILKKKYFIKNSNIIAHSDIAPTRKIDPGIFFPWKELSQNSLTIWSDFPKNIKKEALSKEDIQIFLKNLKKIGYNVQTNNQSIKNNIKIINSFHRHYLPNFLNDKPSNISFWMSQKIIYLTSKNEY